MYVSSVMNCNAALVEYTNNMQAVILFYLKYQLSKGTQIKRRFFDLVNADLLI